jgi:hypothetical protein
MSTAVVILADGFEEIVDWDPRAMRFEPRG